MLPTQLKIVTNADARIQQLANTMFELNVAGGCTEGLLLAEGFSRFELETIGEPARQIANKRFVRQIVEVDAGPTYTRADRLAHARRALRKFVPSLEASIAAELQRCHFTKAEIDDLWDDVMVDVTTDLRFAGAERAAS